MVAHRARPVIRKEKGADYDDNMSNVLTIPCAVIRRRLSHSSACPVPLADLGHQPARGEPRSRHVMPVRQGQSRALVEWAQQTEQH
jgi:hypothetical protein